MSEKTQGLIYTAKRSEYKGRPLLTLTSGANERYPFSFGLQKAKRIVACIEDIKQFVAEEEAKAEATKQENKRAVK